MALVFQGLREFPEARAALEGVLKGCVEQRMEGDGDAR